MATAIPSNEARFRLEQVLAICGGSTSATDEDYCGVSTDTRTLRDGELFVALAGEHYDAHEHLDKALAAGARAALVERDVKPPDGLTVIRVASTLTALGQLAADHLKRWREQDDKRRVVALTGSAGKTTTKEAVAALLQQLVGAVVHLPPGNLNNLIGVPMTLLGLASHHRYAVLELGTNAPGEIAALAAMSKPDVALVTLVALAHTEGLGTLEAVAKEKTSLYASLAAGGLAVGNGDDANVGQALRERAGAALSYGHLANGRFDYTIEKTELTAELRMRVSLCRPKGAPLTFSTPLLGRAGALACSAAVCVAEALQLGLVASEDANEAFGRSCAAGRLQLHHAPNGTLIIDDSYNANPASMGASIELASQLAAQLDRPLVLVLGEMRELGTHSVEQHQLVGRSAAAAGASQVIAMLGDARHIASEAAAGGVAARFFERVEEAVTYATTTITANQVVLVKGSRGVRSERVVQALQKLPPSASAPGPNMSTAALQRPASEEGALP